MNDIPHFSFLVVMLTYLLTTQAHLKLGAACFFSYPLSSSKPLINTQDYVLALMVRRATTAPSPHSSKLASLSTSTVPNSLYCPRHCPTLVTPIISRRSSCRTLHLKTMRQMSWPHISLVLLLVTVKYVLANIETEG